MREELTKKQKVVYDFLKAEIKRKGYPPAIREICQAVNLSSTATVHTHLSTLERKGYIRRNPSQNRSIEILEEGFYGHNSEYVDVPIVGKVRAGEPVLAVENIEGFMPIKVSYIGNYDTFFLRVSGDSMKERGILSKDLILVRCQPDALNGEVVVALIDDSVTVKTYYKENSVIRLQPENPAYSPIIVEKVDILGKVIGLFRTM